MQSELPTVLNVFDTDYQMEFSKSYSDSVHQEIAGHRRKSVLYVFTYFSSRFYLKATPVSY